MKQTWSKRHRLKQLKETVEGQLSRCQTLSFHPRAVRLLSCDIVSSSCPQSSFIGGRDGDGDALCNCGRQRCVVRSVELKGWHCVVRYFRLRLGEQEGKGLGERRLN
nr:hypothetical protein Iba_scaffold259CG0200 [Ipomoea batatas]